MMAFAAPGTGWYRRLPRRSPNRRETIPTDPTGRLPSRLDLARAVEAVISDGLVVNAGVTAGFLLRDELTLAPGQFLTTKSGGLGYGLSAAIGSAIAEEDRADPRPVVGYIGDGSFQYSPQALYTAARCVDAALSLLLVDNGAYAILREAGHDHPALSFDPGTDVVTIASGYGVAATSPDGELEADLRETIDRNVPTMVHVPVYG